MRNDDESIGRREDADEARAGAEESAIASQAAKEARDKITLNDYQRLALSTAIYPGRGGMIGRAYVGLKLNGEAGEVAEHVGKSLRDDAGQITPERREKMIAELGDVLWYVAAMCSELDCDLALVAKRNVDKLHDRKARGVLGGSGSDR